jgi:hypothetical protein
LSGKGEWCGLGPGTQASSRRKQEASTKALQERERKRAEARSRLEADLTRRESERHKLVLSLKQVLTEEAGPSVLRSFPGYLIKWRSTCLEFETLSK